MFRLFRCSGFFIILDCVFSFTVAAQVAPTVRITAQIDERQLVKLPHNTHPLARPEFDRGAAPSDLPLDRMLLVLKRSPAQDAALKQLLEQQQDTSSPNFHKWLTPQQFGERFGPSAHDIQVVTSWLRSHGFRVARVATARTLIEFSGTAHQVEETFHSPIHKFVVNGEEHWANAADQQIPAALAPLVAGVSTLHNFQKKPLLHVSDQRFTANYRAGSQPQLTAPNGLHALTPADLLVIYNAGIGFLGDGETIGIVARSNVNIQDILDFRNIFYVLGGPPQIIVNGPDPGDIGGGDEAEAVLDTSWAGALAQNAGLDLVVSASTNSTDGVFLSEEYIIDSNLTDIITESYGGCEAEVTKAEAAQIESLAEEAAAQGITYAVASGDSGSALCDDPASSKATGPFSVNVLASTPYTVAVGGTEFNEHGNPSAYWSSTNSFDFGSALSYIPEDVWNESCTVAQCGKRAGLWAGGGGASTLFRKPAWQTGVPGIPNDGARDVPDVSLSAAGHDPYLICLQNSCKPNSQGEISLAAVAGTSASTPSFAGMLADIAEIWGPRMGQVNYVLYRLAAAENLSKCNGSGTHLPAPTCAFNDITVGNNAVPGEAGYGTPTAKYQASAGYDLTTGLGSLNLANVFNAWPQACCEMPEITLVVSNALPFGAQAVGTTSDAQWIEVSNQTSTSATISVSVIGANPSDFIVSGTAPTGNSCGSVLAASEVCMLWIQFAPVAAGPRSAVLAVEYGSPRSPASVALSGTGVGQIPFGGEQPGDVRVIGDFDGDGQLDPAVWRPTNGFWYIYPSGSPGTLIEEQWGLPGDIPVPADYDGDGFTDFAVWRPSTETWFVLPSRSRSPFSVQWGLPGDIPVTGDFDGDGKADLTVWRPSDQTWHFTFSSGGNSAFQWGLPGDIPVPGDFDGSGKQEMAIWRPSNGLWCVFSAKTGKPIYQQWGLPGDIPINGDFDGDGKTDFAVWRPSDENLYIRPSEPGIAPYRQQSDAPPNLVATKFTIPSIGSGVYVRVSGDFDGDGQLDFALFNPATGFWFVIPSSNPGAPITYGWGQPGDVPVAGDYDGDGKTDFAVWRPSTGQWWIIPSSNPEAAHVDTWGVKGDIPVPGDYDGDGKTDLAVWRPSTGEWWIAPSRNAQSPYVQQWGQLGDTPVPGDYDGLGKTGLAVWHPTSGEWKIIPTNGDPPYSLAGFLGDIPVAGDFDGDGRTDFAIWSPADRSYWMLLNTRPSRPLHTPLGLTGNLATPSPLQ